MHAHASKHEHLHSSMSSLGVADPPAGRAAMTDHTHIVPGQSRYRTNTQRPDGTEASRRNVSRAFRAGGFHARLPGASYTERTKSLYARSSTPIRFPVNCPTRHGSFIRLPVNQAI